MIKLFKMALTGAMLTLTACSETAELYPVPTPEITEKTRIAFRSVEVRDISLPTYAAADVIAVEGEDGKLLTQESTRWADDPARAVGLELSRNLIKLTGARVASEPWPFDEPAEARLELRFETLIAGADGVYRATGQYFVGVSDGRRERSGLFDLTAPFDPEAGPTAIAEARGKLVLDLSQHIARKGLR